jgi:hypothetical protein
MDYEPLFKLPSGTDDIEYVYGTGRGSTYAHHADQTSTRNRSGANHRDKSTGLQSRSGKTVYMDPRHVNNVAGLYQNAEMATQFKPVLDKEGKPTGRAVLSLTEDYGPRKAGSVLTEVSYKLKPEVGLHPVELWGSESPIGSEGRNIHWGSKITEVHPRPDRLKQAGKVGLAAGLAGAAGAASAGEYRKAAGMLGEMALPWWAGGSELATEEEALEKARRAYGKKGGGAIKMPDNYSDGNWKLI